jgi:creatinine amidohydrolase/Fe(II)-dependent formamide hydrolase-like protein
MEEMTTTEIGEAVRDGKTTALIYSASVEGSGPHLATGKHLYRARYLGEHIARELGTALLAPIVPFAPTSDERRFPGTVHLSPETFAAVNSELTDSMVNTGFRFVILLGDHDGNQETLKNLAPQLDEKYRDRGVRVFYSSAAYAKSNGEIEAYLRTHGYPPSRHGGVSDSSQLWAVGDEYVRSDKIVNVGAPVPPAGSPLALGTAGFEGDPRKSSPKLGQLFLDMKIRNGVAEIRQLAQSAKPN